MNKLLFLLALCGAAFWISCNDCRFEDCEGNDTLVINYVNQDSMSILGGNPYFQDSVLFTPFLVDPTRPYTVYLFGSSSVATEMYVKIDENLAGFVVQLDTLPPDTVYIKTVAVAESKCCDKKVALEKVIFRGESFDLVNFSRFYIIK
jgi:hypothetical protein